jgi:hypothetical protein
MYTVIVTSRRRTEQILVQGYEKEDVDVVKKGKELAACHPPRRKNKGEFDDTIKSNTHYLPLWTETSP